MVTKTVSGPSEKIMPESVEEFMRQVQGAKNLADLRRAWDATEVGSGLGWAKPEEFTEFGRTVRSKFSELGLDLSSGDERVRDLNGAFDSPEVSDSGLVNVGMHAKSMNAIHRILSGSRQTSGGKLGLQPLEELSESDLSWRFKGVATDYTADEQYTTPHRFPRKAFRAVTDPTSEFWGCAVDTDTWPDEGYRGGPNMTLWIPTGRLKSDSLASVSPGVSGFGSASDVMKGDVSDVPSVVIAQSIQLGQRDTFRTPVDTSSGFVRRFLDYMGGMTNKPEAIPQLR